MPTVNDKSLRAELESAKEQVKVLRQSGKLSPEADALFRMLLTLLTLLLAVVLEKTSRNSSIPPSQMDADETAQRARPGRQPNPATDRSDPTL